MKMLPISILVADDDADDRELITMAFAIADPGILLQMAKDGLHLLKLLESQPTLPSMLLIDYNMPVMSGPELLQELKKKPVYLQIPKIVFSTSTSPFSISQCMDSGADKYIVKPGSFDELVKLAQHLLSFCNSK